VVILFVAARHVPESADPQAARRLDILGAVLGAVGLAGLTYGLIGWPERGPDTVVLAALAAGIAGLGAFVVTERRSRHAMLPLEIFASRQFSAANLVTFAVYAALGGVFFFLVLHLQVVGGYSPIVAGTALFPVTALMLLLSARAGALASRIGPRLPMTAGPLVCATGLLLMLRIGTDPSYLTEVLPAAAVFGLGLSLTVAPLTATVLAAAADRHAGVASGVNNAVARAAGLLAVAALPLVVGLSGNDYTRPDALAAGFRTAMMVCAALLAVGGLLAFATIRNDVLDQEDTAEEQPKSPRRSHCAVDGPPLQPHPAHGSSIGGRG
jgi:Na+/melibiose symporter-like transporter